MDSFLKRNVDCFPPDLKKPSGVKRPRSEECAGDASPAPQGDRGSELAEPPLSTSWELVDDRSVLFLPPDARDVSRCVVAAEAESKSWLARIAAFDLDDTLVLPKTGKVFPAAGDPTDWKWACAQVPVVLRRLHAKGFLLVILTNQGRLNTKGWDEEGVSTLREKIEGIQRMLGLRLAVVVSTKKDDQYRKPATGMWKLLVERIESVWRQEGRQGGPTVEDHATGRVSLDCQSASFYCGDAAGRISAPQWATLAGRKKDFACTDRKFAYNIGGGLFFCVPEMMFGGAVSEKDFFDESSPGGARLHVTAFSALSAATRPFSWEGVPPEKLQGYPRSYAGLTLRVHRLGAIETVLLSTQPCSQLFAREDGQQELVIFVGYPSCGKTTFFQRFFLPLGYTQVNQDTLGTRSKCLSAASSAWLAGKSVVIDGTNGSRQVRQLFTQTVAGVEAKRKRNPEKKIYIRIFWFQHSLEEAQHWGAVRAKSGERARVPDVAYFSYRKHFESFTAEQLEADGVEVLYEIPPVACFDELPEEVERNFFLLT